MAHVYTSCGRVRTSIAVTPEAHAWLTKQARGVRGIGELIENLIASKRTTDALDKRFDRIEALLTK